MGVDWVGEAVLTEGVGLFRGIVGDNKIHSHWAAQITIALNGECTFETADAGVFSTAAVFFRSGVKHRLISGDVCSIYFDPTSAVFTDIVCDEPEKEWGELDLSSELRAIAESASLSAAINSKYLNETVRSPESDPRLAEVLERIRCEITSEFSSNRQALAKSVGMSPTRFSHWFVEQLGIPMRSYKKWLKLRLAIDALLAGVPPIEAAQAAGFSDQAHMSRSFSQAFGITYTIAKTALEKG